MDNKIYNECRKKALKLYKHGHKGKYKEIIKHVKNVEAIANLFCREMVLSEDEEHAIYMGCILHDIGKIKNIKRKLNKNLKNKSPGECKACKKGHHLVGECYLKYCEPEFLQYFDDKQKKIILNMVKYHRKALPKDREVKEKPWIFKYAINVIRLADDLANEKIIINNGHPYSRIQNKGGK